MLLDDDGKKEEEFLRSLYGSKKEDNIEGCSGGCNTCDGESGTKQSEWIDYNDGRKHFMDPYHKNLDWKFFARLAPGLYIVSHKVHVVNNLKQPVFMGNISAIGKERYAQWEEIKEMGLEDTIFSVFFVKEQFDKFVVALVKGKVKMRRKGEI
jgi:hypothetical protein